MVFKDIDPDYKELTIHRPVVRIDQEEFERAIPDLLDEVFRVGSSYPYDERTYRNIYFYMDPKTNQFVAGDLPDDNQAREKIKNDYLSLLDEKFDQTDGYFYITEEIFGVNTTKIGENDVRTDLSNKELKHKLLNRVPINRPLTLCTLQIDEFIPRILIIEPITY